MTIRRPLNSETRERMERAILAEYDREMKRGAGALATGTDAHDH